MSIAEIYTNSAYSYQPTIQVQRWWVNPNLMIGGSIVDATDYKHLETTFGIASVLNVETEHSDIGKEVARLCEVQVPDNAQPFPVDAVRTAVSFAKMMSGKPLYCHCQMGGSRSPAFAYAILRWVNGMSPTDALNAVRAGKEWQKRDEHGNLIGGSGLLYGDHPAHQAYLASIEAAFKV